MKKTNFISVFPACLLWLLFPVTVSGQNTFEELQQLTVNEHVTTVITASEPVRLVDISTDAVAGDKPIENVVRLKPKDGEHQDGDILSIVTLVTERYRVQYALVYTSRVEEAVSDKEVIVSEQQLFHNPAVSMSTEEMVRFAQRIWNTPAKYRNVVSRHSKLVMRLNNIYTVGEYFFIDFSVENRSNLRFDIDELRLKLTDKRQQKATNVQSIELVPSYVLDRRPFFTRGYRNVLVVKKLTFPNDKVLSIELSEQQISGRTISMTIDYEDVLSADSFDSSLLQEK